MKNSRFVEILWSSGTGFFFSRLLFDVVTLLLILYFIGKVLLPVIRSYRLAVTLDRTCGSEPRHWLYGHVKKFTFSESGIRAGIERAIKHPFICNSWLGPFFPEVTTHHPDSIKSVLSSDVPKNNTIYQFLRPWIGDGLLTSYGKKWQRNRRLLTPAFHYNILKPYMKIYNHCAKVFLDNLESEVGNPVEISERISLMTLDVMLQCAMSFETNCQNVRGKHPYISAVRDLGHLTVGRYENPIMLIDWIFYLTSKGKRFKEAAGIVHDQAEKVIAHRRSILAQKQPEINENLEIQKKVLDFLDILLETKDEDGKGLTDAEIRDEVDTFLFEGHDTTASGLSWMMYNLAKYPEYQEKCRDEVMMLLQEREVVQWDDLPQLPYLTMFIKESMRLNPPVPSIGRYLNKPIKVVNNHSSDVTLQNVNVAAMILINHRNPAVWADPERFDPERFTLDNISKRSSHAFIPFSAGPRNCIGQNFAMNEIKVVLCQVLRRYRLYLDRNTPPPRMKPTLVLESEDGILVKFENYNNFS